MDTLGQLVIPHQYQKITQNRKELDLLFKNGKVLVSLDDEIFYIDKNGNRVEE